MKWSVLGVVFGFALVASPEAARAQAPASPAPQPPPAAATPPRPFPEGSKIAFIDIQRIAA